MQQNVGAPLPIHRKSQERVDNMCLISSSLGAIYSREGRKFSCDIFPLGAFSRRGELLLKPKAFSYGIVNNIVMINHIPIMVMKSHDFEI